MLEDVADAGDVAVNFAGRPVQTVNHGRGRDALERRKVAREMGGAPRPHEHRSDEPPVDEPSKGKMGKWSPSFRGDCGHLLDSVPDVGPHARLVLHGGGPRIARRERGLAGHGAAQQPLRK